MFRNIEISFNESKKNKSWLDNGLLINISSQELHKVVQNALLQKTPIKRIKTLSNFLSVEPEDICLISRKKATVNGKKNVDVICTTSTYNEYYNSILKETGTARFDNFYKMWKIQDNEENKNVIIKYIISNFKIIVDYESMCVFKNEYETEQEPNQEPFMTLPYHKKVSLDEFIDSLCLYRENDIEDITYLYLFNGDKFEDFDNIKKVFWTQSPFLLFRYNLSSGQPRYVVYSTIGKFIERIIFQSNKRDVGCIIGKFKEKIRYDKNIFIKPSGSKIIKENNNSIMKLREDFIEYEDDEKIVNSILKDCYAFPLSSSYIDSNTYVGENDNISAYASHNEYHNILSKNIAIYFGYKDSYKYFFPIVFNKNYIEFFDSVYFQSTMVHEMAHHIVFIGEDKLFDGADISMNSHNCGGHNLAWILSNNVLMSILEGFPIKTNPEYYDYEPIKDLCIGDLCGEIDIVVENIILEITIEHEDDFKSCTLEYFCNKIKEALYKLSILIKDKVIDSSSKQETL